MTRGMRRGRLRAAVAAAGIAFVLGCASTADDEVAASAAADAPATGAPAAGVADDGSVPAVPERVPPVPMPTPTAAPALPPVGAEVEGVLGDARTAEHVSAVLGRAQEACVPLDAEHVLCEWVVGNRQAGWRAVADAIGTSDRVGVLCVLPADGSEREEGSCTGHPRRSNRARYRIGERARSASQRTAQARRREEYAAETQAALDAATTLLSLSRLLGTIPRTCFESGAQTQVCTWGLSNHTLGHGTVATSIRADPSKKVRLRCELPLDDSPRAPGSCTAQIGS